MPRKKSLNFGNEFNFDEFDFDSASEIDFGSDSSGPDFGSEDDFDYEIEPSVHRAAGVGPPPTPQPPPPPPPPPNAAEVAATAAANSAADATADSDAANDIANGNANTSCAAVTAAAATEAANAANDATAAAAAAAAAANAGNVGEAETAATAAAAAAGIAQTARQTASDAATQAADDAVTAANASASNARDDSDVANVVLANARQNVFFNAANTAPIENAANNAANAANDATAAAAAAAAAASLSDVAEAETAATAAAAAAGIAQTAREAAEAAVAVAGSEGGGGYDSDAAAAAAAAADQGSEISGTDLLIMKGIRDNSVTTRSRDGNKLFGLYKKYEPNLRPCTEPRMPRTVANYSTRYNRDPRHFSECGLTEIRMKGPNETVQWDLRQKQVVHDNPGTVFWKVYKDPPGRNGPRYHPPAAIDFMDAAERSLTQGPHERYPTQEGKDTALFIITTQGLWTLHTKASDFYEPDPENPQVPLREVNVNNTQTREELENALHRLQAGLALNRIQDAEDASNFYLRLAGAGGEEHPRDRDLLQLFVVKFYDNYGVPR